MREISEGRFPWTHEHLLRYFEELNRRTTVRTEKRPWYVLHRSRAPELLRPKIVCPHFALVPRFGLDLDGRSGVTARSFIALSGGREDEDVLVWLAAVLNSSVVRWWIDVAFPRLKGGYAALEVKYLRDVPIPETSHATGPEGAAVVRLVRQVHERGGAVRSRRYSTIDRLVFADVWLVGHDVGLGCGS